MISRVKRWLEFAKGQVLDDGRATRDAIRFESGCIQTRLLPASPASLAEVSFKVYSQYGEDGILQYLTRELKGIPKTFVEIGVEDYRECNTRFLAEKDGWRGLAVDPDPRLPESLRQQALTIMRSVDCHAGVATEANIRSLATRYGPEPGILSIDIDSLDYWVLKALTDASPWIIVVEYRPMFGPDLPLTVPNQAGIGKASHSSGLLYGASLAAWHQLLTPRGYHLVGTSDGPNAFFVRSEFAKGLPSPAVAEAWKPLYVREGQNPDGSVALTNSMEGMRALIQDQALVNPTTGEANTVREWFQEVH